MKEWRIKPKIFQEDFLLSEMRYPGFVAGWGTGKSLFAILKGLELSKKYPGNLGLIVRREYTDLRDSTVKDFERYTGKHINEQNKEYKMPNKSLIMFRHAKELDTLKNVNLGWFWIEQAEELETMNQFIFLIGRLRRDNVGFRTGFITANVAGHNWVWKLWKENVKQDPDYPLSEATTYDNADNLPADYIQSLKKLEPITPSIYNRYVMNSWEEAEAGDWIIPVNFIEAAEKRVMWTPEMKKLIACDPARMGGDKTVIDYMENTEIVDQEIFGQKNEMEVAGRLAVMAEKHSIPKNIIALDSIGVGGGIVDRLRELKRNVLEVNSARKENVPAGFLNLRAQMWWEAGKKFREGEIVLHNCSDNLKTELSSVKYEIVDSSGKLKVEKKEKIIARIGHSPDEADAYIYGLYALQYAKVEEAKEGSSVKDRYRPERVASAMAA